MPSLSSPGSSLEGHRGQGACHSVCVVSRSCVPLFQRRATPFAAWQAEACAASRHRGCAARLTPPLTSLPPAGDDAAERLRAHCSFTTCQRCDGGRPLYRASRRRAKPRSALSTRGHTHLERFETTNWARRVAMQCGRESHV